MSYLVLARKYRPQTFEEVVGQEHVTRTLSNAFEQNRVHHAFLFCGPRGVGKTTAARILGKALNCEKGPTATPCGECSACTTIAGGTAVDYFEMDGASNRGIDAIRELTDAVRYQPAMLRKKVYVIDEVHMLTTEAFNALLKTLEEPPPHVAFVLATTEPHKVPNTILSRCQRYDFKLVPTPRLAAHIEDVLTREGIVAEPAAISLIVRESGGSVRDSLSLTDQVISYVGNNSITEAHVAEVLGVADRALTRSLVTALADGDARTALSAVDAAVARGVDEVQLSRAIVRYVRDLSVIQVTEDATGLVEGSSDELAALGEQASALSPGRVRQMYERMLRACEDLGQTQQPRLVFDLAMIDLATVEPLEPLGDLIDRLSELESRLSHGGGGRGGAADRGTGSGRGRRGSKTAASTSAPSAAPSSKARPAPVVAAPPEGEPPAMGEPPPPAEPPGMAPESAAAAATPDPAGRVTAPVRATGSAPKERPTLPDPRDPPPPVVQAPRAAMPTSVQATADLDPHLWEGVIAALDQQRRLGLVRLFQEAKLLHCTREKIEVAFAVGSLDAELAADKDKIDEMTEFLVEHVGGPVVFKVRQLSGEELESSGPSVRSLVELSEAKAQELKEKRELEAREHPITKMVLETFRAEIKEIKTDV